MHDRNQTAFSLNELCISFAGCFISESYVQAYLLLLGLTVQQISLYGTLCYAAALLSYVAFTLYRPKNGSYFGMFNFSTFPLLLLPLALCLAPRFVNFFPVLLASAFVYQICGGFRSASSLSVVPMLFPRRYYGRLLARCGTVGYALGALISIVNAFFVREQSMSSYEFLFAVSAALYLLSALSIRLMRPHEPEEADAGTGPIPLRASFTAANLKLLTPHFLRGIATGGFYYFVVASFSNLTLPDSMRPLMVTVGVCGLVAGVFFFGRLEKRFKTGSQIFVANIVCALCGVLTALNRSPVLFLILYFVYMLTNNLTGIAVPTGVIYSTPMEELPFISSMRMLAMSGASCATIPVWGKLMDVMPIWTVMLLCAGIHILTGYIFKRQYTDPLK